MNHEKKVITITITNDQLNDKIVTEIDLRSEDQLKKYELIGILEIMLKRIKDNWQ